MVQFLSMLKNQKKVLLTAVLLLVIQINVSAQCSLTGWSKIAQGENFSIALKQDGTLWIWGRNLYGISGNGSLTATEIQHPTQIGTETNWTDISTGRYFALGKKANGDLYGWGANDYGQLGLGNNTNVSTPTLIQQNVTAFSAGYFHTLVVKSNGTVWGTGYNDWSGLALGTSNLSNNTFQQESTNATDWASVCATYANSFAIKTNGTLWAAGTNIEGQTGLGTPASLGSNETAVFTQVGTDTNWTSVVGGIYHTVGLKSNGQLWAWGGNGNGRLGIGTSGGYQYTPQQVSGTDWASISATNEASSAIKTDGSLWAWGYNQFGKLGIGTSVDVNVPTRVGTDNDWLSIPARSGENSTAAIRTSTNLWSWGYDGFWQLGNGDGTATSSNVPTQVKCVNDASLSVNDLVGTKNTISVYPNPVKDVVFVKSDAKVNEIKIYSLNGALVKTVSKLDNGSSINVSELTAGTYILKINNDSKGIKLIKK